MSTCPIAAKVGGLHSQPPKIDGINPAIALRDKKAPIEDLANSGNLESCGFCNDRVYDFSCQEPLISIDRPEPVFLEREQHVRKHTPINLPGMPPEFNHV